MSKKTFPTQTKAASQKKSGALKFTAKELEEINLDDLRWRFLNPVLMARLANALSRISPDSIERSARRTTLLSQANDFAMRYGILEIAAHAGFISVTSDNGFWDETRKILEKAKIEELSSSLPFFALPQLLLRRIRGEHNILAKDSNEAQSFFLEFLSFDTLFKRSFRHNGFLYILEARVARTNNPLHISHADPLLDIFEMPNNPEDAMWRLMLPREECDKPTRVLQEFGEVIRFCKMFSTFLNRCGYSDLVQSHILEVGEEVSIRHDNFLTSECWCYYRYLFGIIRQQFDGTLGPALGQFLGWASKLSNPKDRLEIEHYVAKTRAMLNALTHPKNALLVHQALGLTSAADVADLKPIKMPVAEAQMWAEAVPQQVKGEEDNPFTS